MQHHATFFGPVNAIIERERERDRGRDRQRWELLAKENDVRQQRE
jgi:hypothetical protein